MLEYTCDIRVAYYIAMIMDFQGARIRRADPGDLNALLPLVAAYRTFYEQASDAVGEHAFVESHLRDETSVIFVAEIENALAGFTQMFPAYSTVYLAPSWILEDLYVVPGSRGRGVATALLERTLLHARASGACGMFLETAHDNQAAQRVYERTGWVREGRFLKYNAPL